MTCHFTRWTICSSILSLMLVGCASDRSKLSPSLMSELKAEKHDVQRVSYRTDTDDKLGSKDVEDEAGLKFHFARWMEELQNYPEARKNYNAVLADSPENVEAIIGLARVDQASGRIDKAEVGFQRALALRPDSPVAQHAYGQFQLSQGRTTEALPLLNKAMVAQPSNNAYRYHLAVALAQSGDTNAALPHFKRTVGEAAAHHNIATILRDKGDFAGAEQHFRQALTIDPEQEQSRHALTALYKKRDAPGQLAGGGRQNGSVTQSAPNNTALQSITPAQFEQIKNQQNPTR